MFLTLFVCSLRLHVQWSPLATLVSHSLTFLFLHSGFVSSYLQGFISCFSVFLVFLLNAFSCRFSEQILLQLSFIALKSLSSMSCPVCTVAACTRIQHITCFAGCVYTEVALSLTSSSMWPLLERSVHVTSDFHCEWAIVAMQTMASTDDTFLPWGTDWA